MIELHQVSAGYGKHQVLQDLSVAFEQGNITGIIGVNGSGKSTLLKTILGMVPNTCGGVTVEGKPIRDMTRNEIARKIAYLSQEKTTPDMTVEQLVLHGRFPHLSYPRHYSAKDREIAAYAMEQTGVSQYAKKALQTLSGGMRQRAYIAMALAQDTDYVFLDEPTTHLDIAHQLELMKLLRVLADRGKGIVMVLHDLPLAFTFSDRIILLDRGRAAMDAEPRQICADPRLAEIFGVSVNYSEDTDTYSYRYSL